LFSAVSTCQKKKVRKKRNIDTGVEKYAWRSLGGTRKEVSPPREQKDSIGADKETGSTSKSLLLTARDEGGDFYERMAEGGRETYGGRLGLH